MNIKCYLNILPFFVISTALQAQNNGLVKSEINNQESLFKLQAEQLSNKNGFLRYSALTGYREDVVPIRAQFNSNFKTDFNEETGTQRIYMYNLSIQDMLTHGLRKSSTVVLEVNDPSIYRYDPPYGDEKAWLRKNGYCYELVMPKEAIKGIKTVDEGLQKLFNVECKAEKRLIKTLVLFRTSLAEKFKASGIEERIDTDHGVYKNTSMASIGISFYEYGLVPFLDETNYKYPVDLNLGVHFKSMKDLPEFRKALHRYDLDLKEETREIEVFIIKEINKR